MLPVEAERLVCPVDGSVLTLHAALRAGDDILTGTLASIAGRSYQIVDGIPRLFAEDLLAKIEVETRGEYDRVADEIYDRAMDWQFAAFLEDENKVRESMVDMLELRPGMRVLEIGCGTGRDSFRIARRLGQHGLLHLQDLSPQMVCVCRDRLRQRTTDMTLECRFEYSASSATALPFSDGAFDAVFHFGGFNNFGDLSKAAAEMARVAGRHGRVVIGDEAVAPWLKGTEFEGIVVANNPLFKAEIPMQALPLSARDVTIRWVLANCFYVIAFNVGDGPPPLDLDLPHAGLRGGSMRSRYFGVMEGVSPQAKQMARTAAAAAGVSIHAWLDDVVRSAATKAMKA
jgi:ubiquinone/menaquinone biosynthesis C-methylase UbiE/uncharacterized protein YbaR (Trm112 family)